MRGCHPLPAGTNRVGIVNIGGRRAGGLVQNRHPCPCPIPHAAMAVRSAVMRRSTKSDKSCQMTNHGTISAAVTPLDQSCDRAGPEPSCMWDRLAKAGSLMRSFIVAALTLRRKRPLMQRRSASALQTYARWDSLVRPIPQDLRGTESCQLRLDPLACQGIRSSVTRPVAMSDTRRPAVNFNIACPADRRIRAERCGTTSAMRNGLITQPSASAPSPRACPRLRRRAASTQVLISADGTRLHPKTQVKVCADPPGCAVARYQCGMTALRIALFCHFNRGRPFFHNFYRGQSCGLSIGRLF